MITDTVEHIDALALRAALGRDVWGVATAFGPAGYLIDRLDGTARVIVTCSPLHDAGIDWRHASISRPDSLPTYADLTTLHRAAFGDGWAYQVFAPQSDHVNIHPNALHLWGHCDGTPALPNFGRHGTI